MHTQTFNIPPAVRVALFRQYATALISSGHRPQEADIQAREMIGLDESFMRETITAQVTQNLAYQVAAAVNAMRKTGTPTGVSTLPILAIDWDADLNQVDVDSYALTGTTSVKLSFDPDINAYQYEAVIVKALGDALGELIVPDWYDFCELSGTASIMEFTWQKVVGANKVAA